jgi:hypothetical protein
MDRKLGVEVGHSSKVVWRKSSHSPSVNDCVEVAKIGGGGRLVRNSKLGEASPVVSYTESEWAAFLGGVKDGEFD